MLAVVGRDGGGAVVVATAGAAAASNSSAAFCAEASAVRVKALTGAGILAYSQGDYRRAAMWHEESLALRRDLGDLQGVAGALADLGHVAHCQGNLGRATALYEESLAVFRRLGDTPGLAHVLTNQGGVVRLQGDYARAARKTKPASKGAAKTYDNDNLPRSTSLSVVGQASAAPADAAVAQPPGRCAQALASASAGVKPSPI